MNTLNHLSKKYRAVHMETVHRVKEGGMLVINLFVPNSKPICKFSEWHDGLLLFPTPPKGRETVYGTLYRMFSDSGAYHLGVSN